MKGQQKRMSPPHILSRYFIFIQLYVYFKRYIFLY
jgi:hypothetical protein